MNKTNLLRVADAIEKHEIEGLVFNMNLWIRAMSPCGTAACIGGTADVLRLGSILAARKRALVVDGEYETGAWLGLDNVSADELFFSCPTTCTDFTDVTPQQAVNVLRYAAEHDVIDWDAAQTWAASKSSAAP